jgi:hypothetical protein
MTREQAIEAVKRIGVKFCVYSSGPEWAATCDCKYGVESDRSARESYYCGEQTGCPEMRSLQILLMDMTDEEYAAIKARSMERLAAAFEDLEASS